MNDVIGYTDRWSLRAGESTGLHVHVGESASVSADLVDLAPATRDIVSAAAVLPEPLVRFSAHPQRTQIGSCAISPIPMGTGESPFTLSLLVKPNAAWPGTIAALAAANGAMLTLRWSGDGRLAVVDSLDDVRCEVALPPGRWSAIALVVDDECTLHTFALAPSTDPVRSHSGRVAAPLQGALSLWLAAKPDADGVPTDHVNASVEAPALHGAALTQAELRDLRTGPGAHVGGRDLLAAWDFSHDCAGDVLHDRGPHGCHGRLLQGPTRLIPGAYWRAGLLDPMRDPSRFAAARFHADDLLDAGWTESARLTLPDTVRSGVYGVRVTVDGTASRDVIPIWVRPAASATARPLAFLAPTYTYLAYGNAPDAMLGPAYWGGDHPFERIRRAHREFGPSLYSRHPDKSGVSLVSRHRPILTVRPGVRPWGFEADRLLTGWLGAHAFDFDVLTDEDVDREGISALAPHRVVVTGNHPEYWSAPMLDALERWLHEGGRLVYLGGNGFYWRISTLAALPGVIECRRAEGGTRPWIGEPGESHHQLDGEPAGLWRRLGRAPQQLVGVGFAGQGFETSAPYRVLPAARQSWAGFALQGIDEELIGTSGVLGGGAAGQEIDRHDRRLGSPADAIVIASSQGLHDSSTLRTLEELLSHEPYAPDPKVRADMTLTPCAGGGAVFSTGSMAFVGALGDASISRVMRNVLDRFADPAPLRE